MQPPQVRNLVFIGILTWAIVGMPGLTYELQNGTLLTAHGLIWGACFVGFLLFFWLATRPECHGGREAMFIIAQSVLALVCSALQMHGGIQPVLLVIVAGQLGHYSLRVALLWVTAQTVALTLIYINRTDTVNALYVTLAYFAFQLFGLFTTQIAHSEAAARQALAERNAELTVTTGLLEISSRTSERIRIARDLHDLLGHHLAALSLNLEVAGHLAAGEAREQIEKSKSITKLLLSDVRDVVSRLREEEPVDLTAALQSLQDVITAPALHLDVPNDLALKDSAVAQVALRTVQEIVTNAVRHSGARNLWLKLTAADHSLAIDAHDDGAGTDEIRFGNGLRGIRERVEQVHGDLDVSSTRGRGFRVHVRLPLEAPPA
jgi:signal transduction histidine kinase